DHVGSQTASDLLYKGALKDRARTIYSGTVIVRKGAHKCDAYQTNRNVLLSEEAKADSIPNLEILSNDPVRCGHAASVGPVGEVDVDFEIIECTRHGSTFDLRTGKPRTLPATVPIATFPVKVEGDTILIELEGR